VKKEIKDDRRAYYYLSKYNQGNSNENFTCNQGESDENLEFAIYSIRNRRNFNRDSNSVNKSSNIY